jgi:hypothetical protein
MFNLFIPSTGKTSEFPRFRFYIFMLKKYVNVGRYSQEKESVNMFWETKNTLAGRTIQLVGRNLKALKS